MAVLRHAARVINTRKRLLVRYSAVYGVTPDGAGSQEFGTEPDIVSPVGETALDTCRKALPDKAGAFPTTFGRSTGASSVLRLFLMQKHTKTVAHTS